MNKITILLLTILLSNPVYSMELTNQSTVKEVNLDLNEDGKTDVVIGDDTVGIDIDEDGEVDIKVKKSTIKKLSKYLLVAAIGTYGVDTILNIIAFKSDIYNGGDLLKYTNDFITELIKMYGPKIIPMIQDNLSKFVEIFKGFHNGAQYNIEK